MTQRTILAPRLASTAIAAALAALSIPAFAQEVPLGDPAPQPEVPAPSTPAPAPVQPTTVMTSAPVVQQVVDPYANEPAAAAPAMTSRSTNATAPRSTANTARTAQTNIAAPTTMPVSNDTPGASNAASEAAPSSPLGTGVTSDAAALTAVASGGDVVQPSVPVAEADTGSDANAVNPLPIVGLLGALGLAGVLAMRRRKNGKIQPLAINPQPRPAPQPASAMADTGIISAPVDHMDRGWSQSDDAATRRAPAPAAFAMPDGPVPSGEARHALIGSMVAAQPDAANPFRSAKARRKRARIILASREQQLRSQAVKPFDWRTYEPSSKLAQTPEFAAV